MVITNWVLNYLYNYFTDIEWRSDIERGSHSTVVKYIN